MGFDRLTEIVPELSRTQGRSESVVLKGTVDYLRALLAERDSLLAQVKKAGKDLPSEIENQLQGKR